MITRDAIIEYARTQIGVRFQHQGRNPGVCLDCVGLLVVIGNHVGHPYEDMKSYGREPDAGQLITQLDKNLDRIDIAEILDGDVFVIHCGAKRASRQEPRHVCIKTPIGMLHTSAYTGKVVESGMRQKVYDSITHAYRFRGLTDG